MMGRKKLSPEKFAVTTSIRLTPAKKEKFKQLGGIKWLNKILDAEMINATTPSV